MAQRPRLSRPVPPPVSQALSEWSSESFANKGWAAENFMLGAGMIIIQPSTHKIVLVYDTRTKEWFLPAGRKDMGESLETTALREAYEESGYQVEFLPLYTPCHAPAPPGDPEARSKLNREPVFVSLMSWEKGRGNRTSGGQYLMHWYVGQIPKDAVYTKGTGMPDEQTYTSHLKTYDEAMKLLSGNQYNALRYAWAVYTGTRRMERELQKAKSRKEETHPQAGSSSNARNNIAVRRKSVS